MAEMNRDMKELDRALETYHQENGSLESEVEAAPFASFRSRLLILWSILLDRRTREQIGGGAA